MRKVVCICGGFGFPVGTASTNRILLMGKALAAAGVPLHVLHLGPSACYANTEPCGNCDGVSWEYLSPSVKRPAGRWLRLLYFLWGGLLLPLRLFQFRKKAWAYIYYQGCLLGFWALLWCRLLRLPAVQECCEWWPGTGTSADNRFARWIYEKIMFRWSAGALPISQLIEERLCKLSRPGYPQLRVPVLVDAQEVRAEDEQAPSTLGTDQPYFLWCGMVDGYMRDPKLLVAALGCLAAQGQRPRLVLCGPCSASSREELTVAARGAGLDAAQVVIAGFVSDIELNRLATHAAGLLLPMWDDDRSRTRFPTKLGLYAAAGRPIVSCAVGEIAQFLENNVNALFFPPGDARALAERLRRLLTEPELSERLGATVRRNIAPQFDYRTHGPRLATWYRALGLECGDLAPL
jgi:glycosyltransferase involved in cell wall biosynthesis